MRSHEHRAIGDEATGGALVNLGGEASDEPLVLSFGDVVALSGDYFRPAGSRGARPSDALFSLAPVAGDHGNRMGTRDEIVCALKVMSVDEGVVDPRFEPGGELSSYELTARADRTDVERRVRDRYLTLAAHNDDHLVSPGRSDAPTGSGSGAASAAYRDLHQRALDEAWRLGRSGGDLSSAMAREAAAQHYLTDAFAAGHLRTPVADIRRPATPSSTCFGPTGSSSASSKVSAKAWPGPMGSWPSRSSVPGSSGTAAGPTIAVSSSRCRGTCNRRQWLWSTAE